jgi:amidase
MSEALLELSAVEARRLIGTGVLSPIELLDSCLARMGLSYVPCRAVFQV